MDDGLHEEWKLAAANRGLSMSAVAKKLLEAWLAKQREEKT